MGNAKFHKICIFVLMLSYCECNNLGSLIEGLSPFEEIKLDGETIEEGNDKITIERDDGNISLHVKGKAVVSVGRSTGIQSGHAKELLDIIQKSIGTRYQLMSSLKRGGRYLTLKDDNRFNEILNISQQEIKIFVNDKPVDLDKASLIEANYDSTVLEPEELKGVRITLSNEQVTVKTDKEEDEMDVQVTRGLNKKQLKRLRDNFYEIVAEKVSDITGLAKPIIEVSLAGRNTMVERLSQLLQPVEQVMSEGKQVDLDKSKAKDSPDGLTLEPEAFPKVKIIWKKDGKLRVESDEGSKVNIDYSKGVEEKLLGKLVDGLHRAVTLRLGMISWSNKLLGSLPNNLESTLDEIQTKLQKRAIFVDGEEIDLKSSSVVETTDESVLYRLPSGIELRVTYDGTISTEGGVKLAIEVTPGISETQAANLLARVNQISTTTLAYSTDSGEILLNDESNRKMVQSILRGIKIDEKVTVDDKTIDFDKEKISKTESDYTEYKVDDMEDVTARKFTNGDVRVDGKDRKIIINRSSGLTLEFLNRLVVAIYDNLPRRKRWFYDFGTKVDNKGNKKERLQDIIDEIPTLIQNQTFFIDDKLIDIEKASIINSDDTSTVYSPETNSKIKMTKYVNGDVEIKTDGGETIGLQVSPGITTKDSETILNNIQKILGDKIKIKPIKSGNWFCSSGDGDMGKLLETLLDGIRPITSLFFNTFDVSSENASQFSRARTLNDESKRNWTVSDFEGRGKIMTATKGGKLSITLSTGLTQESLKELMDYLYTIMENKEDVIKVVTGSFPDHKIRKIKDMIKNMIQEKTVQVDSKRFSDDLDHLNGVNGVLFRNTSDGSIQIESTPDHRIGIAVGPGLTRPQAEHLYSNVMTAFRQKFSEITHIPFEVITFLSTLKKYSIKSYFYSAAPPKELIKLNDVEIHLKNATELEEVLANNDLHASLLTRDDGTLVITNEGTISMDVTRTSGLDDRQIDRILKGVEFKLGIKNKMFPIISEELNSTPDEMKTFEEVIQSLITSEKILIKNNLIDLAVSHQTRLSDDCVQYRPVLDLTVKRCHGGKISVDYRGKDRISLEISSGISSGQAKHIINSFQSTIRNKSSNIKILANFPDTFFKLLANGRIQSLENLLMVLIPREEIEIDGHRIKLEPLHLVPGKEYQAIQPKLKSGLQISRYLNGTIDVKSSNGGTINVIMNTGISDKLIKLMLDTFKDQTTENISPYLKIIENFINSDAKTIFTIVDGLIRQQMESEIDVNYFIELVFEELKTRLQRLKSEQSLMETLATTAVQKQQVYINNKLINIDETKIIDLNEEYVMYSLQDKKHIKIKMYNNGRLIVDSQLDQPISVRVTGGIPPKLLASLMETLHRFSQKMESDTPYAMKVKNQIKNFIQNIYTAITEGVERRQKFLIDDQEIILSNEDIIRNSDRSKTYFVNDTMITIDRDNGATLESKSHGKFQLQFSLGMQSKPVIHYLRNNSIYMLKELYQSYQQLDNFAPMTSKLEKILDDMHEQVTQKMYIHNVPLDSKSFSILESTNEFTILQNDDNKITYFMNGTAIIERKTKGSNLHVHINNGLPASDLDQFTKNLERLFSRFNPIEVMADFFDILPRNFFILSQNMDRVISILNTIKL